MIPREFVPIFYEVAPFPSARMAAIAKSTNRRTIEGAEGNGDMERANVPGRLKPIGHQAGP
jgi:hypothetical protein